MPADVREEDLLSLVRRQARLHGGRTFMSFGDGTTMSFADLDRRVSGFRARLDAMGVAPGDAVGLMMENSLFYPVAWLGIVSAGALAVPINHRLGETDARYVLEHSAATALIVDDKTSEVAGAATTRPTPTFSARRGQGMEEIATDEEVPAPELHGGTMATIQYTSGTTGFPKGCLLTHRYWQRMGQTAVDTMGITEDDVLLTSQAHSYIDPLWNVIAALRAGAHLVLLDGFHPSSFMKAIADHHVTLFYCLGVMPVLLLKQPPSPLDRKHRLRRVYCSAIPLERHAEIEDRWGVPWFEAFGMTETGINIVMTESDHDRVVGTGCIGRAVDRNEAIVVDDEDRELLPGEVGELCVRGVGLMHAYHRDPEATAAFFRNGWAHTGDLAARDAEGLIYYKGRRKEMIRRAGENISPVQIEDALAAHPDVVECAVAPVPDPDVGEEIKAYVVMRDGTSATVEELASYLESKIARFKVPRYWELRDALPRTSSEKIAKSELERDRADWRAATTDLKT